MTGSQDWWFIDDVVPGIRCDAKYAGTDNFTGAPVDGYGTPRLVGSRELCAALASAQRQADAHGWVLLVWDAYRPLRAVDAFLRWSRAPEDAQTKQRHHPHLSRLEIVELGYVAARSGHCRGGSVDLTLCYKDTGEPLDMGGRHDLMDPISHHDAPGVGDSAAENRNTLRALLGEHGFTDFAHEWWHYTLIDEPYPDIYFDFPITAASFGCAA